MARKDTAEAKEPGRIKQMWQVFQMTRRYDPRAQWYMLGTLLLGIVLGLVVAFTLGGGDVFSIVLWVVAGLLLGALGAIIVLGRRAERAAYSQIEGQPGAVGAVLRSSLKRSWRGSEMPVAVNGRTRDAVYRAVGRGGVVLIGEGPESRTRKMVEDERRKVARIVPNVPINVFNVGPDSDAVPLHKLSGRMAKIKVALTKPEVLAVDNRLTSLGTQMPIPKGVDPLKVRPQRAR
ncbi:DUF4191 domain-containing protein [Humibacter sp. RRB41]|uniref:DUF4191 domain-containing protein n=1 Tax=Humibacter sp. RRB41 TaxID=2919946 RepID=UPI001FAA53DF|nr:DUF4191 domain-containing protein [Humibacter sp. RRB41]